jgi:hypothetical protein
LTQYDEVIEHASRKGYIPLFGAELFENDRNFATKTWFKCEKHDFKFFSRPEYIVSDHHQCKYCLGRPKDDSPRQIKEYVQYLLPDEYVEQRNDSIYIPSRKTYIDYMNLYDHSELCIDKEYHSRRFDKSIGKYVGLQFFEDEWRDRRDVCKNIIKNRLGLSSKKYNARKTMVDSFEYGEKEKRKELEEFINRTHLQGNVRFNMGFVLRDPETNKILICVTMRRAFTKHKSDVIEIARVCSEFDCVVRGGFSKLFKRVFQWVREQEIYKKILTYSDCRISEGNLYKQSGFVFINKTPTDYFYTDLIGRDGRFKHRAQKPLTEAQVAAHNRRYKIFGCGHYKWEYELK